MKMATARTVAIGNTKTNQGYFKSILREAQE